MFRKWLGIFAILALLIGAAPLHSKYAEGQIWEYRTRPSDAGSLIKIQKIENLPALNESDKVYHLSVIGLHFNNEALAGVVMHIPVSQKTLDSSVTRLSELRPDFPDPSEGISQWREARGGVFTVSLAEIMDFVEQTIDGARRE